MVTIVSLAFGLAIGKGSLPPEYMMLTALAFLWDFIITPKASDMRMSDQAAAAVTQMVTSFATGVFSRASAGQARFIELRFGAYATALGYMSDQIPTGSRQLNTLVSGINWVTGVAPIALEAAQVGRLGLTLASLTAGVPLVPFIVASTALGFMLSEAAIYFYNNNDDFREVVDESVGVLDETKQQVIDVFGEFGDWGRERLLDAVDIIREYGEDIADYADEIATRLRDNFMQSLDDLANRISDVFGDMREGLESVLDGFIDFITEKLLTVANDSPVSGGIDMQLNDLIGDIVNSGRRMGRCQQRVAFSSS